MTELHHVPLKRPLPDARAFVDVLMGRSRSSRVPLVEYIAADTVIKPVVTDLLGREWAAYGGDRASLHAYLDNFIAFWLGMGYDFVRFEQGLPLSNVGWRPRIPRRKRRGVRAAGPTSTMESSPHGSNSRGTRGRRSRRSTSMAMSM